jgi:PAS domain S-box-containing protein
MEASRAEQQRPDASNGRGERRPHQSPREGASGVLERIAEDFFAVDSEWRYTYLSEREVRRIRSAKGEDLKPDDLLGKSVWEVFPEQVGSVFYRKCHEALSSQEALEFEAYLPLTGERYGVHAYPSADGLSVLLRDVTERKRTEERLRKSQERFSAQYRSFPVPTFTFRRIQDDFELVDYNEAADRITRGGMAGLLGVRASEWYAERPQILEMLSRSYTERTTVRDEIRWQMVTTGERKHFAVTFAYMAPDLVIHYAEDITERKEAEERLAYQAHLLENIQDAILATDETAALTAWNKGAERMYGWRAEEVLGRKIHEVLPTGLGGDQEAGIFAGLTEDSPHRTETIMYRKDGTPLCVDVLAVALRGEQGAVTGYLSINRDISERKRAERELEESHALLDSIIEQSADPIFVKDTEGRHLLVNSACARDMGKPAHEIVGKRTTEIFPPEVAAVLVEADRRVMDTGEHLTYEECYPAGHVTKTYLTVKAPYRDHRGKVIGVIGVSRDITERKRAEEALDESHTLLRSIIEATPDPIFLKDVAGRYLLANSAACEVLGESAEEILGKDNTDFMQPEAAKRIMEFDQRVMESGESLTGEEHLAVRGVTRTFLFTKTPYRNLQGEIAGVIGIARDITERKRAEESLRRSTERFHSLVRHSSDVISVFTADGTFSYSSPAIERMAGYSAEEVIGKNAFDLVHPEDLDRVMNVFTTLLSAPEAQASVEFRFRHKDGSWHYQEAICTNLLHVPGVEGIVVNSRNTTERKSLEEKQQRFLANAAHQLKTPLTTIVGAAELLVTKRELDATRKRQLLDHILSEGRRMQRLSNTLLRLARIGQDRWDPDLEPVDLTEAARQATKRMMPLAENLGLDLRVEGDGARALADPEWLQEVLLVLLGNAAKYSGPEQVIRLRARESTITVQDEGTGISDADLTHVFERFYRGKGSTEGFGLGLSIGRELVERMGGTITIDSREGSGTRVEIRLPDAETNA